MQQTVYKTKNELRLEAKNFLKEILLDKADFHQRQVKLIKLIEDSKEFQNAKIILNYFPFEYEFDLTSLILSYPEKKWVLPRPIGKGISLLFEVDNLQNLKTGKYGLKVPAATSNFVHAAELDLVIMPGLAFDKKGYRLGHGFGYYDRLLDKLKTEAKTIAVVHEKLYYEKLPVEEHDRSVDKVLVA